MYSILIVKYTKGPLTLATNSGDIAWRLIAGDISSNKFIAYEKSQARILSPETVACYKIIASYCRCNTNLFPATSRR